jgi:hypothetical protein
MTPAVEAARRAGIKFELDPRDLAEQLAEIRAVTA